MNDNLSTAQFGPQQFWHEPVEPGVGYHVADPEHRESIERYGLRPGRAHRGLGNEGGVYWHDSLHGPTAYPKPGDIYKVDTTGLEKHAKPDPVLEYFDVPARYVPHSISRSRITRIGERTPEGIVLHPEHHRESQGL